MIAKLKAYNVSLDSCVLLGSYLHNRKQRTKICNNISSWSFIPKGVPQGSIIGSLAFNFFINDIFYIDLKGNIFNYADDSEVDFYDADPNVIKHNLENDAIQFMNWFKQNGMKANPNKFQFIILEPSYTSSENPVPSYLCVDNYEIKNEKHVKILGVTFDKKLNFTKHINNICKKTGKQVNILKQMSSFLDYRGKVNIHVSFIKSNFLYCSNVWYFCGILNLKKSIEKRCLRFVSNDYDNDYKTLLVTNTFDGIQYVLFKNLMQEVYKCVNNINPDYLCDPVTVKVLDYDFSDHYKCVIPMAQTVKHGQNNFVFYGSSCWNKLSPEVKSSNCIDQFKNRLTNEMVSQLIVQVDG